MASRKEADRRMGARREAGYSLTELLVVLVIVGVLAITGSYYLIGNRGSSETRVLLDELEGVVLEAQKQAVATSQDVTLVAQGNWDATASTLLSLCHIQALSSAATASALTSAVAGQMGLADTFHVGIMGVGGALVLSREAQFAGVAAANGTGGTWWAAAMATDPATGKTNQDITTVVPFSSATTGFQGLLGTASNNLFQGGAAMNQVTVSGLSKRFMTTFFIQVVGLRSGQPYAGAPMGLLVVQANGGSVFKFYNPGVKNGNGKWRRI